MLTNYALIFDQFIKKKKKKIMILTMSYDIKLSLSQ